MYLIRGGLFVYLTAVNSSIHRRQKVYTPDKLEPGQIWINTADNPLLIVQSGDRQGTVSVVVLKGFYAEPHKHSIPVVLDGFIPDDTYPWEYVGMLGDKENE
jgi:hypothetical protein